MKQLEIHLNNGQLFVTYVGSTTKEDIMASAELQEYYLRRVRRHLKIKNKDLKISEIRNFNPK